MADVAIDKAAGIIMSEQPKFSVAIKNLISVLVARSQVVSHDNATDGTNSVPKAGSGNVLDSNVLLLQYTKVAQVFLKELSLCGSHDVVEWGVMNPQGSDQGGFDRIDQLTKYKVCFGLRKQVLEKGEKVSKYFGKSLILWTNSWSMLREAVESKMKEDMNSHIPQERVQLFLDTLAKSLKILPPSTCDEKESNSKENVDTETEGVEPASDTIDDTSNTDKMGEDIEKSKATPTTSHVFDSIIEASNEDQDDSDLIWATNTTSFNQILAERQQQRKQAVREYQRNMEEYRALTAQLQGVGDAGNIGSDRVEELPDK